MIWIAKVYIIHFPPINEDKLNGLPLSFAAIRTNERPL